MQRSVVATITVLFVTVAGWRVAGFGASAIAPQPTQIRSTTGFVPAFQVDPFWPKPLPGNWMLGHVAGKTSDILLLVDPRSAIDVVVPRTGGRGILRGKSGENGYRCSIEYLQRGQVAQVGDKVVTSGLGGAFPRNLAVGKVTRVIPGAVGLYQDVEVTPDVDFARLSEVLVVAAPPPAPDPDAGNKRGAATPARGPMVYR